MATNLNFYNGTGYANLILVALTKNQISASFVPCTYDVSDYVEVPLYGNNMVYVAFTRDLSYFAIREYGAKRTDNINFMFTIDGNYVGCQSEDISDVVSQINNVVPVLMRSSPNIDFNNILEKIFVDGNTVVIGPVTINGNGTITYNGNTYGKIPNRGSIIINKLNGQMVNRLKNRSIDNNSSYSSSSNYWIIIVIIFVIISVIILYMIMRYKYLTKS